MNRPHDGKTKRLKVEDKSVLWVYRHWLWSFPVLLSNDCFNFPFHASWCCRRAMPQLVWRLSTPPWIHKRLEHRKAVVSACFSAFSIYAGESKCVGVSSAQPQGSEPNDSPEFQGLSGEFEFQGCVTSYYRLSSRVEWPVSIFIRLET